MVPTDPPDGPDRRSGPAAEAVALLAQREHNGQAGQVLSLPRPLADPRRVLLAGIGAGDEGGWRAAGAALARAAARDGALTVAVPAGAPPEAVRGLAEGLLLASYRFALGARAAEKAPKLRRVTIAVDDPGRYESGVAAARAVAEATHLARDLTNTPSLTKNPGWFARRVRRLAGADPGLSVRVRDEAELRAEGFGGLVAVGAGSASPPCLVELSWRPRGARTHVVLVGKGITFDTGGVSIKPRDAMLLMRKDMGGAAAVVAATLGAAAMNLPVRVTALAPLAENMVSGSAFRPGDVVRHWGGRTSEIRNTDAEGRVVLADTLAYAVARLRPDLLVDLATLTGANAVALGKRTAALYSDDDDLAAALSRAAGAAGEQVWQLPLAAQYADSLGSDLADLNNAPDGGAGSILAALYLREFARPQPGRRPRSASGAAAVPWAHLDMSAPAWIEKDEAELSRGATGWGVRTLLRWLETLGGQAARDGSTRAATAA
jgi:leucyl aminopeptidase